MPETHDTGAQSRGDVAKPPKSAVVTSKPAPPSMDDLEADIEATRQRLTQTIAELKTASKPANIAQRQIDRVKDFYTDEYGALRTDRVVETVAVVVAVIAVRKIWKRARR